MEPEIETSDYAVCEKCGVKYSTLTRHRCFKTAKGPKAKELGKAKDHDLPEGGDHDSLDEHECPESSEGEGENGEAGSKSRDQGEGEGEGEEGSGQAEGEGEGEGEGDGEEGEGEEGEGEGPAPKAPDPETPPVAVVCTVLKFAALTAQCAKNGMINVILSEDGLFVSGHNGDLFACTTIPWGEFEKRSTLDGEFYVKEVIDGIDKAIGEIPKADYIDAILSEHKPKAESKSENPPENEDRPRVSLPLQIGQRVICLDGEERIVATIMPSLYQPTLLVATLVSEATSSVQVYADTGLTHGRRRQEFGGGDKYDVVADVVADDDDVVF